MASGCDSSHKTKVVVVNDEPIQRKLLESLLIKEGMEVLVFGSAGEALEWLVLQNATPHLIVTDLHMPGIDGWRFCRLLRSPEYPAFNKVPLLIVSATYAGEDVRQVCTASGADAFLPLPVKGEVFMSQVRSLIAGKAEPIPVRVLVVEDSATLASALKKGLERYGYKVEAAGDGQTATRLFAEMNPQLVLLDYHLPDTTGERLLETFTAQKPRLVVVMLTADSDPNLAVKWMKQGAAAYVRKPFKVEYLATICARVLREQNFLSIEDLLEERTRQLHESEERFRAIVENTNDAIYIHDFEGTILDVNERACRMLGYERKEFLGANLVKIDMEWRPPENKELEQLQRAGSHVFERKNVRKDGSIVPVEVSVKIVTGEGKGIVQGFVRDITERKRAEEALRQSELNYRTIFDSATDAIFVHDPKTGRIIDVNKAACSLWGYSREEMQSLDLARLGTGKTPYTEKEVLEWVRKAIEEGPQFFEWNARRRDDTPMWFEDSLKSINIGGEETILVVGRDITKRKQMELALKESEERFRSLVEHSHAGIFMVDESYRFVYVNDRFCRIMGYSREELVGKDFRKLLAEESLVQVSNRYLRRQRGEPLPECYEAAIIRKDGEKRISDLSVAVIMDAAQNKRSVGQVLDITDRKRAEEEILRRHRELELVLDSVVATIWYLDTQGRVVKWNSLAEKASGLYASQVRGRTIHTIAPTWDDLDRRHQESLNVALTGQPLLGSIESFRRNAEVHWVRVDKVPWRDINGAIIGVILFIYDITDFKRLEDQREKLIGELRDALAKVKTLTGLLPICSVCKKIRNDKGNWEQIELYIRERSEAEFSHGLCPDCAKRLYPECYEEK